MKLRELFTKRNVFDLSHERKFSCKMGELIPCMLEPVIPGDTFKIQTDLLIRLAPMLAPMMHRVNVFVHYFFVPFRILWVNWESFITGGEDGEDANVLPKQQSWNDEGSAQGPWGVGSLGDYFGYPTGINSSQCAFPARAYGMIYNEWYRDQDLQDKVAVSTANGNYDTTTQQRVLKRNWEKDYFTSARPWPQKGDAVTIGLGTSAPVSVNDTARTHDVTIYNDYLGTNEEMTLHTTPGANATRSLSLQGTNADNTSTSEHLHVIEPDRDITGTADLTEAGAVTINALRLAFQVQKWLERNARAGSRYVESLLSHFGVRSSDARLQRPEYLGGGKASVVVSEVLQTSATDTTPQGNMAGHGYGALRSMVVKKSFEEHGLVMGLLSIMPRTAYQQGNPRLWRPNQTRYDFYWPEFANLGEQEVTYGEIYHQNDVQDDEVFGYQGRYDEYRRRESTVHGAFRDTLDFWHMGRIFGSLPELNSEFVQCNPTARVFADELEDHCWVQIVNIVKAMRPLPLVNEPGLIDHN